LGVMIGFGSYCCLRALSASNCFLNGFSFCVLDVGVEDIIPVYVNGFG